MTDEIKDGLYEKYYDNGQLKFKGTMKDGKLNGPYETYLSGAPILSPFDFLSVQDLPRSFWQYGKPTGSLLLEKGTMKDGKKNGPFENYHGDGQVRERGIYKDGRFDGLYEWYRNPGQLCFKGTFKNGEPCGEWLEDGKTVTYPPCPPDLEGT